MIYALEFVVIKHAVVTLEYELQTQGPKIYCA